MLSNDLSNNGYKVGPNVAEVFCDSFEEVVAVVPEDATFAGVQEVAADLMTPLDGFINLDLRRLEKRRPKKLVFGDEKAIKYMAEKAELQAVRNDIEEAEEIIMNLWS